MNLVNAVCRWCGLSALALSLAARGGSPALTSLNNLPLCFEAAPGQQFVARGLNYQFLIAPAEVQIVLSQRTVGKPGMNGQRLEEAHSRNRIDAVQITFVGANPRACLSGTEELPGKINYLVGNDTSEWRTGVRTYSKVRVEALYPGIDLVYYGNQQRLEYDLTVAPGGDPGSIAMRFEGAESLKVTTEGDLLVGVGGEQIRQPRPVVYQEVNGSRRTISGAYRFKDSQTVTFAVGKYDPTLPLVIDPFLSYSSYFGGNKGNNLFAVALDAQTNVYIAGETLSTKFPFTFPDTPFQSTFQGGNFNGDAFIAKFDSTLTNLLYFTYLGGKNDDGAYAIAVDPVGHAYLTGFTDSPDFPTNNALYPQIHGHKNRTTGKYTGDAFVTELETNGSSLIYSTYLGGSKLDVPSKIAIDSAGDAFIAGSTSSIDFPTTNGFPVQRLSTNNSYAFVTELASNGTRLLFSSLLGGTNVTEGEGIALLGTNVVFISGYTSSTNFPTTTKTFGTQLNGSILNGKAFDGFVAKFDTAQSGSNSLLFSTLLGGVNNDVATRVAVDATGNAFVTGYSKSLNFPGSVQASASGETQTGTVEPGQILYLNVTVPEWTRFATNWLTNATGPVNLLFNQTTPPTNGPPPDYELLSQSQGGPAGAANSTFILSPASTPPILPAATYILGIQNTNTTNVSFTLRVDFDVTAPMLIADVPGLHLGLNGSGSLNSDAFLTKLSFDSLGISNIQSVLFGGTGTDIGWDVAVETNSGNVYVIGSTSSVNFPTTNTVGRLTMTNSGHYDVFVTVVSNDMSGLAYSTYLGGRKDDFGYGIAVDPGGDAYIVGRTLATNFPTVNAFTNPIQRNNNGFVAKIQFTNPIVSVTIQTAPVNLQVLVDGVTNLAPVTFSNWIAGSTHTLSTLSVQETNGVVYVWTNWSDGGTLTHTVVPLTNITITAGFGVLPSNTVAVVLDGKGSVSPNLSRNTLQAGHSYTVTAKPASGYLFWGWSMISGTNMSTFITNSPTLTFVWEPGLVLQAGFILNPFIPLKGNYAGLFFQTNEVLFQSSGFFTETLQSQGTFSGKIILAGKNYSFSGRFTTNGSFSTSIPRSGAESVSMSLQLNFDNNSLSGELSNSQFVAELQANRKVFASTNPAPQSAFRYTVSIPGSDDSSTTPGGSAYGTVTVNSSGNLQFSGTLGDGTKVSQGTFVSEDGQWPLYSTLYSQKGSILGFLTFTNEPTDDLSGLVNWFKPPQSNSKLYPAGFTVQTNAFGSIYSFFRGLPVLNFSPVIIENGVVMPSSGVGPGQVVLENGGLTENITNNIIIGGNNVVTNKGPNRMSMSITTSSGLFHGSIVDPATSKSIPFNGAVLQKTNIGAGTFLGTTQSGRVLVTPRP